MKAEELGKASMARMRQQMADERAAEDAALVRQARHDAATIARLIGEESTDPRDRIVANKIADEIERENDDGLG